MVVLRKAWIASSRKASLVANTVWHLFKDLKKIEMAKLLTAASGNNTFIWHRQSLSSETGASLPWAVNFPLSHHRKHIFRLISPTIAPIQAACDQWRNRLLWRTYYENAAAYDALYGRQHVEPIVDMVPFRSKLPTPSCPHELPEVRWDADQAVQGIIEAAGQALTYHKVQHKNFGNTPNVIQFALTRWKEMKLISFPTDKDGCLAVAHRNDFTLAKRHLLDSPWYGFASPSVDYAGEVWSSYKILVDEIAQKTKKTFPGLFECLTRDAAYVGIAGIMATLGVTVKTHTPHGQQAFRPLHKSTRNPLNPGMRFLRHFMREYLSTSRHIIKNSAALKEKLDSTTVLKQDLLVKGDLKDFF